MMQRREGRTVDECVKSSVFPPLELAREREGRGPLPGRRGVPPSIPPYELIRRHRKFPSFSNCTPSCANAKNKAANACSRATNGRGRRRHCPLCLSAPPPPPLVYVLPLHALQNELNHESGALMTEPSIPPSLSPTSVLFFLSLSCSGVRERDETRQVTHAGDGWQRKEGVTSV